jgi:hypothetical protein
MARLANRPYLDRPGREGNTGMGITWAWLRLDMRRRWRALIVLALLIALATATVLTAVAGARRGQTAWDRLWAGTLPATATVLANEPGFDWAKVRGLPEVSAMGLFVVYYGAAVDGLPGVNIGFPYANAEAGQAIERPVVLAGRRYDPARVDEVNVSAHFVARSGKGVGDTLTVRLSSPAQADAGFDASSGRPAGPAIKVRIVGVVRSPFWMDAPGDGGGIVLSNAVFTRYRANIMGTTSQQFVNALVRLRGGASQIPAFRGDLARVAGRNDIDVWNNYAVMGGPVRKTSGYEAAWLLAFGAAALLAGIFLVGQSAARHVTAGAAELRVLQAVGLTRSQAVGCATLGPTLAAVAGAAAGLAGAFAASGWMPIGVASLAEPHPGSEADWLVLIPGWLVAVLLVTAGTALAAWLALPAAARAPAPARQSRVAVAAARAGLPVALVVGIRFALEPGRGHAAVPVRSALAGVIAGVLGVLAAFTFYAGVTDAAANPARFGQTWQLDTYLGFNGQDFSPAAARVMRAVAGDPDVTGVDAPLVAGAQTGRVSIESFTYEPVAGKGVQAVLTAGRMPASATELVLGVTTARALDAHVGSVIRLDGGATRQDMTVTGVGFVPAGPHNDYDQGAWLTLAGFQRVFHGAHYAFKYHLGAVAVRPGADLTAVARRLDAVAAAIKGGQPYTFSPSVPPVQVQVIRDVAQLPLALSGFLAVLAAGAVGHALTVAVRRRRRELAVLRALGLTRMQSRAVVVTHAGVHAVIGLAAGIPLGLVAGRLLWRAVADFTPLAYQPPLAVWVLLAIGPATLLTAAGLAMWPGHRAARLRPAQVLRAE